MHMLNMLDDSSAFLKTTCGICCRYASQARRILKSQQLMNELSSLFTDPADRDEIQQGVLG